MREIRYDAEAAVDYARKWALGRNSAYYNFDNIGGDCTNFASQCVFAGAKVMNYTSDTGWYYRTSYDRTASWTGVEYLYRFLIGNNSVGPYARVVPRREARLGDIVQLGRTDRTFYHTSVITSVFPKMLVAAHSFDVLDKPLDEYSYETLRFLHIEAVRTW